MLNRKLSKIRAAAGKSGAAARWDGHYRATACIRIYPSDAKIIRSMARSAGQIPADIVADFVRGKQP